MSDWDTRFLVLEKIMVYQHDLICLLESKNNGDNTASDNDRIRQDKAIIAELKNVFYGSNSDGLVYID